MEAAQMSEDIILTDNSALKGRESHYNIVEVDTEKVLKSWRDSLFAYEWMTPDGKLKSMNELPADQKAQRSHVEELISQKEGLNRPVLGIGLMENIEIGAGKAEFLTLAAQGLSKISVHIPKSNSEEFEKFIV